jgi:hypothetical protein
LVPEDHLFFDLIINHRAQSPSPRDCLNVALISDSNSRTIRW